MTMMMEREGLGFACEGLNARSRNSFVAQVQPYFATERGRAAAERARLDALEEEASANDGTDIERESASSVYAAWVLDRARAFKDAQASAKVTAARANASARELTARLSWMTSTNAEIDDLACASEDAACAVLDLCASLDALDDVFARASELDVVDET